MKLVFCLHEWREERLLSQHEFCWKENRPPNAGAEFALQ